VFYSNPNHIYRVTELDALPLLIHGFGTRDDAYYLDEKGIFDIINLAGLPGLSMPCGFDNRSLPLGLQIVGRPFDEALILRVAAALEDATGYHHQAPKDVK
jgi:Asp-tRNA(Asn)/Glu-tRNA(Gln) amidotransferase A subunit family amidase